MHDHDADDESYFASEEESTLPPVEVPIEALSPTAVAGVIEAFVLREGTDYGAQETPHEVKVEQVRRQLERGEIIIVYLPASESVTLMTLRDWARLQGQAASQTS